MTNEQDLEKCKQLVLDPEAHPISAFHAAIKLLDIEDFGERIFNSHSRGELMHLQVYTCISRWILEKEYPFDEPFRDWFLKVVAIAEKNWKRPESVFQHIEEFI